MKYRVMYLDPFLGQGMLCSSVHRTKDQALQALDRLAEDEPNCQYPRIWEDIEEWEEPMDLPF